MTNNKTLRLAVIALLVAALLFIGIIKVTEASFNDTETSSGNTVRAINNWYDLAWHWRKAITLNNAGGALSNFQVKMTINTQALVSAGHMLSTGNDIRLTTSDGMTSIPYWIESGINTASTVIWAKIPAVPAGSSTIYIYYGNSTAAAVSDGAGTFIFFDNFETDLSKWTVVTPKNGTATQVTNTFTNGNYSMQIAQTAKGNYGVYAGFTAQTSCVIEYSARPAQTNALWETQVLSTSTIGPHLGFSSGGKVQYNGSAWTDFSPVINYAANTWYSFKLNNVNAATDTYDVYLDGNVKKTGTPFHNVVTSVNRIEFLGNNNNSSLYVDLVKVRAYAAAEPTVTGVGAEE